MSGKTIRIGGASGFWGDSMMAARQLVEGGDLDYLVFDYLAEITMSIMARARAKNEDLGYATDFVVPTMKSIAKDIAEKGIKVIANAGGVNPAACASALEEVLGAEGVHLNIAYVTGDDLMDQIKSLRTQGIQEMFTGEPLPPDLMSMNAYLGARPISDALGRGADIVVTGRVVDSAVTLGACMHEFAWRDDEFDQLSAGSLAGHILECGAQATGGLHTDWNDVPDWSNIGYPVAEISADGSFVVEKPPRTGGLITRGTIAEQMLYEIGDPQAYILPDVVCDFSDVRIAEIDENKVQVSGARGAPPTDSFKVSGTYADGFRVGMYLTIGGIEADGKARKTAEAVFTRLSRMLAETNLGDFTETSYEVLGTETSYGPHARITAPREVVLKLAAKHDKPDALNMMVREATSSATSMAPGTTGMGGNRPKVSPVVRLFSCLVPKADVTPVVHRQSNTFPVDVFDGQPLDLGAINRPSGPEILKADLVESVPLVRLAWARSGDKGDSSNIGVIARKIEYMPYICSALTESAVKDYFAHIVTGKVTRYYLPGIDALNFLMTNALGGGGIASLRNDPQGKALAQMLLDFEVAVPAGLVPAMDADETAIA